MFFDRFNFPLGLIKYIVFVNRLLGVRNIASGSWLALPQAAAALVFCTTWACSRHPGTKFNAAAAFTLVKLTMTCHLTVFCIFSSPVSRYSQNEYVPLVDFVIVCIVDGQSSRAQVAGYTHALYVCGFA